MKGELGDQEQLPSGLEQRAIHQASIVGEDSQTGDLFGHVARIVLVVIVSNADQRQQPAVDSAGGALADRDRGALYTHDDGAHQRQKIEERAKSAFSRRSVRRR